MNADRVGLRSIGQPPDGNHQKDPAGEAGGGTDRTANHELIATRSGPPRREPKLDPPGNPEGVQRGEQDGRHNAAFTADERTKRGRCRPAQNGVHQRQ